MKVASPHGLETSQAKGSDHTASLVKDAIKLKARFQKSLSQATNMERCIAQDAEWDWANSDKALGALKECMKPMEDISGFERQWVMSELKDIQNIFSRDQMRVGLAKFKDTFDSVVGELENCMRRLQSMHRAAKHGEKEAKKTR